MDTLADFSIEERNGRPCAVLTGDWTSTTLQGVEVRLESAAQTVPGLGVDARGVQRCDTSGAYAILDSMRDKLDADQVQSTPRIARLFELVAAAVEAGGVPKPKPRPFYEMFDRIGRGLINLGLDVYDTMAFNGRLVVTALRAILRPHKIRWAPLAALAERAGLDALPIVAMTSFFIGAVVGLIGANMLQDFGAQVFAVELIGIAVLREFGVVITAVLLAGRSASAFAAEIGAMKMNEEIDAMRIMGVDPFEALVLPRFLALLFTMPILVFVADLAGLVGGMMVTWSALEISPSFFFQRIHSAVPIGHFWVGIAKAPVLAIVIAAIGCKQGMEVGDDVQSLGKQVTSAVVQSIFALILIDAIFALIYMELNV